MKHSKYIVFGVPLDVYCREHNLNFHTQSNRVRESIKKHPELSKEEAGNLAISKCGINYHNTKYWYGDITLAEWCSLNDKNYCTMVSRVEDILKDIPNLSDREATRIAIEDYDDNGIKYFFDGMPLADYCRLHPEYSYNSVLTYVRRTKAKNKSLGDQEIVNSYFQTEHSKYGYHFIDDMPLMEFCMLNGINYRSLISDLSIKRREEKYKHLSKNELLDILKEKHLILSKKRKERENLKKIFDYLKSEIDITDDVISKILEYLKIDYPKFLMVKNRFANFYDCITFIWYFYDNEVDGLKSVDDARIDEIIELSKNLPSTRDEIQKFSLYYLIAMYKANVLDTRNLIILHQENFQYNAILKVLKSLDIYWEDEDKWEIMKDANLLLLEIVERNNINNIGKVINYVTKSTRFFIGERIMKVLKDRNVISLFSPVFRNESINVIDRIVINNEESSVSEKVQKAISELDKEGQALVHYKYYECLSDDHIASILNLTLEELDDLNKRVLEYLSKDESLKKLVKE